MIGNVGMSHICRAVTALVMMVILNAYGAAATNVTARILGIMYNIGGVGGGTVHPLVEAYAYQNGISTNELEEILIAHIRDIIKNGGYRLPGENRVIEKPTTAIIFMAGYCSDKGLAVLKELSKSEDEATRWKAQYAIVRLGGKGLFPFMRDILENTAKYWAADYFGLLKMMRYYYLTDGEYHVKAPEHYSAVVRDFLLAWTSREPDDESVVHSDEWLVEADADYSESFEREKILAGHFERMGEKGLSPNNNVARHLREELAKLQALPEKTRTHIKIKTLDEVCKEVTDEDANVSYASISAEWLRQKGVSLTDPAPPPPFTQ